MSRKINEIDSEMQALVKEYADYLEGTRDRSFNLVISIKSKDGRNIIAAMGTKDGCRDAAKEISEYIEEGKCGEYAEKSGNGEFIREEKRTISQDKDGNDKADALKSLKELKGLIDELIQKN